jgi:diacylglycerol kinase (ATP)
MKTTQHWTIIYNPTSGTYRPRTLDRIQRALHEEGVRSVAIGTNYAGHAPDISRSLTGTDVVACYSGDGTLDEVVSGMIGRKTPLAFIPGGTANVMAHELGLGQDPIRAVRALLRGGPRAVHPGTVGPGMFLLMAGIGFDANAVNLVSPHFKAWAGKGAYVWAGVRALFERDPDLQVKDANGGGVSDPGAAGIPVRWVVAARSGRYGGPFRVHPTACLEAPTLGVAAVGSGHILPFLVRNLGMGETQSRKGRWLLETTRLVVETERPAHLQVDGDAWGRATRFEIGISPEPIRMIFPGLLADSNASIVDAPVGLGSPTPVNDSASETSSR